MLILEIICKVNVTAKEPKTMLRVTSRSETLKVLALREQCGQTPRKHPLRGKGSSQTHLNYGAGNFSWKLTINLLQNGSSDKREYSSQIYGI